MKRWINLIGLLVMGSMLLAEFTPVNAQAYEPSSSSVEADQIDVILADGQFVYGPNVTNWDTASYLTSLKSPLSPYASILEDKARYYSINPQVLLALLEMQSGLVTGEGHSDIEHVVGYSDVSGFADQLETLSSALIMSFYSRLYRTADFTATHYTLALATSKEIKISAETNAGTFALLAAMAPLSSDSQWQDLISAQSPNGFVQTYERLFPDSDPLDNSNKIMAPSAPPANLLKLPFAGGDAWMFTGGPHAYDGCTYNPWSGVDFAPGIYGCAVPGNRWVTAPAAGTVWNVNCGGCQVTINHGNGWWSNFYHIANQQLFNGQSVAKDQHIGNPSCRPSVGGCGACGGYATGIHAHYNLMYNGAFYAINGTSLEGWIVNSTGCYEGYLQNGGQQIWVGGWIRSAVVTPPEEGVIEVPNIVPPYGNGMCDSAWYGYTNDRGYSAYLTLNTNDPNQSTNSATWTPNLRQAGYYKVEAYIPTHSPVNWQCPSLYIQWDTSDARYTIHYADNQTTVSKDQAPLFSAWLDLGTYYFNAGTGGWVELTDLNGEANLSHSISFSAMRFTLVSTAPPSVSRISGRVINTIGKPIPDATVTLSNGSNVTTDANGYYVFEGVSNGAYTVTPSKNYLTFSPSSRTVVVGPSQSGQDFTGNCSISPGSMSKQPVLLVHGWGAPDGDLMKNDDSGFEHLSKWLFQDGYIEGCNLFFVTGVKSSNSVNMNSQAIQNNIRDAYNLIRHYNPNWRGHFDIIAHSYGGLNSRFYLESALYNADNYYGEYGIHVDNLFTMGTPHGGARVPSELYPGTIYIAKNHLILDPYELISVMNVLWFQMDKYNETHHQPLNICYRLIGGDFLQQANVPWQFRNMYAPWSQNPGDMGVSIRSTQQLLDTSLNGRYPQVTRITTVDMHGYMGKINVPVIGQVDLSNLKSYVTPINTYAQYIRNYLGAPPQNCRTAQDYTTDEVINSAVVTTPTALPVLLRSEVLTGGQTITGKIPVDWSGKTAFYINWSGDLDLTLKDPANHVFTPETAFHGQNSDYGILISEGSALATYLFTDTLTGNWNYTVTAKSAPFTTTFDLYVIPESPLVLQVFAPELRSYGASTTITASLFYSNTPITNGVVSVKIRRPDQTEGSVSLRDDGSAPDLVRGDGIYSAFYNNTRIGGFYHIQAEANGVYAGRTYYRNAETVFAVAPNSARLNNRYTGSPQDTNADGLYETLNVTVGISVTEANTFTVAAVLQGAGTQYIDLANATLGAVTGATTATLKFSGQAIRDSGINGPYTVTQVRLVDDAMMIQLDESNNVLKTAFYDYREFGEVNVPPAQITLTAPVTGLTFVNQTFTAAVNPTATALITYIWQIKGQLPITRRGDLSNTITFNWMNPGTYVINVTATKAQTIVTNTSTIVIQPGKLIYLPIVLKKS